MANPVWPATLPSTVLQDGFQETFPDNNISIKMGTGPTKTRRRTSVNTYPVACKLLLSAAQVVILKTFYSDSCYGTALPFDWVHPRTQDVTTFKFLGPPVNTPAGGVNYFSTFGLEVQP